MSKVEATAGSTFGSHGTRLVVVGAGDRVAVGVWVAVPVLVAAAAGVGVAAGAAVVDTLRDPVQVVGLPKLGDCLGLALATAVGDGEAGPTATGPEPQAATSAAASIAFVIPLATGPIALTPDYVA
jgi:hypothetical protein